MSARKLSSLVAVLALCILFATPAVQAVGPDASTDDSPTMTTTSTGDDPTGPTEHSPNMDPDGLTAATPGDGAGTLFGWIERFFAALFANVV